MIPIKILIVEDNTDKLSHILRQLLSVSGVHRHMISDVRDAVSAKLALRRAAFDLLILDLHIPLRLEQGDGAAPGVGRELLREMMARAIYRRPAHIVGLTAYDGAADEAASIFSEHLWSLLRYEASSDGWADQLKRKVEHIIRTKEIARYTDGETFEADFAMVTALRDPELDAVLRLPCEWTEIKIPFDNTEYYVGTFTSGGRPLRLVCATAGRMGLSAASALTTKIIYNFRPKMLAMCGISAGVRGKVHIGDIIVGDPCWNWGSGKYEIREGKPHFAPAPEHENLEVVLRAQLQRYARDEQFLANIRSSWPAEKPAEALCAHVAPMASGAAVLADQSVVDEVVREQQRKVVGIEMEAYAVMLAASICSAPRPAVFCAKSVSDFADSEKSDQFRSYAAFTSSQFAFRIFCSVRESQDVNADPD